MSIRRRNIIGVDIGSCAVKLVQCKGARNWKSGMAFVPEGVMIGNKVNSTKLLSATIRKAKTIGHIGRGKASLCLSGADIIIRNAVLPRMNADQLKQNVIDEISGYLAVDPAQYVIDYKVQDVQTDGSVTQYKVMIVAVPKNIITSYLRALSQAGLSVISVDVAANAREKLVNYLIGQPGNYAVIDLGMNASVIDTYLLGRFFVRKAGAVGLNTAIAALSKALELDQLSALEMILDMNQDPACRQAVSDYVNQVVFDALRVTDYFRSRNQMSPVDQVYVCGGGARIPGILQLMQERMSLPVQDMSTLLSKILQGKNESGPLLSAYAAAAGATLAEVD